MKIEFDEQKLKVLEVLISAAGKSPATDTRMMLLASDMLRYIGTEIEKASKPQDAPADAPIPNGGADELGETRTH